MAKADLENPKPIRRAKSRIPTFETLEGEAQFWDTHDSTEFEDEFEDVKNVRFVKASPKKAAITLRLEQDTLTVLTRKAQEKGIGPSTLARIWILEHLRELQEKERQAS